MEELLPEIIEKLKPKSGLIIAVEGLDGSGKSTQTDLLRKALENKGLKVKYSAWNSSDLIAQQTKEGKRDKLLSPYTFSIMHAADFLLRMEQDILPEVERGHIVLCDRYYYTGIARDAARGIDKDWLANLYSVVREPDLKFFIKVPIQETLLRITKTRSPHFYESGQDYTLLKNPFESYKIFQERVYLNYMELVKKISGFVEINGLGEIDTIHNRKILPLVEDFLKQRQFL